jgi:carbonic anhydrase
MSPVSIVPAGPADLPEIRTMLEEYAAWVGVDLCFQGFADELRGLPGGYAPPGGDLFIARIGINAAGMVAFRASASGAAEMKRLYVRPSGRGQGLGRALVSHVIGAARQAGYERMILDTLPVMRDAQRMYEQFGFRDIEPYYHSPIAGTRFMSLDLTTRPE